MVSRFLSGVPVLLLAEIPFMMAKFATFDAFSKLAYNVFPQATESVAASLAISLVSGMVGEFQPRRRCRGAVGIISTRCFPGVWFVCCGRPRVPFERRPPGRAALVWEFNRGGPSLPRVQFPGSANCAEYLLASRYLYLFCGIIVVVNDFFRFCQVSGDRDGSQSSGTKQLACLWHEEVFKTDQKTLKKSIVVFPTYSMRHPL